MGDEDHGVAVLLVNQSEIQSSDISRALRIERFLYKDSVIRADKTKKSEVTIDDKVCVIIYVVFFWNKI